ncbi:MAG: L-threonylcarbamoyladenylate synthase [Actinomycetota bacterium]
MNDIARAATALRRGELVIVPTDTVYGLAALPAHAAALQRVFAVKGRPAHRALPVLGAGEDQLEEVVRFNAAARALGRRFWPGPLTMVLPTRAGFDAPLGGPRDTTAVRVPRSEITLELLRAVGPLAVTSANRSGEPAATTADDARRALGADVEHVLDAGPADGVESTIVALTGAPEILRAGALSADEVLQTLSS